MPSNIEYLINPDGTKGETWNILTGCKHKSAGCDHCWAERMANRQVGMRNKNYFGTVKDGHWTGKVNLIPDALDKPLHWRKPRTVFVNSMSDLFHESVPYQFTSQIFRVMERTPQHLYQVLTKRPERMHELFVHLSRDHSRLAPADAVWPLPNVHLYTSIEDQATADERIPWLLKTPAAVHGLSLEPMLGPVPYIGDGWLDMLDHVIVGPETGPGARPMDLDWVRGVRDQCVEAGVKFFFKAAIIDGKRVSMPLLDGRTWDEMPTKTKGESTGAH